MNFVGAKPKPLLPFGYAFDPTKRELVSYYLKNKILGSLPSDQDLTISTPQALVSFASNTLVPLTPKFTEEKEKAAYMFNCEQNAMIYELFAGDLAQGSKDENEWYVYSTRPDRKFVTADGFYSVSAEENISQGNGVVGFIRILTYYQGWPPRGKKTNWIIQEFRVNPDTIMDSKRHPRTLAKVSSFVACKIVLTEGSIEKYSESEVHLFDSLIEEAVAMLEQMKICK